MPDYAGLCAEWQEMLTRRRAMGDALALWTSVLDGWRGWRGPGVEFLEWSTEECRERWNAASPLVEDWVSPHLDHYAAREGYWRGTPSLAQLLPPAPDSAA